MPRKKPFSGKQKKKQLSHKRERKQRLHSKGESDEKRPISDDSESEDENIEEEKECGSSLEENEAACMRKFQSVAIESLHKQPKSPHRVGTRGPNRYNLQFQAQREEEILKRKFDAKTVPLAKLEEELRGSSVEEFHPTEIDLDIPKRPPWHFSMPKDELEHQERMYFNHYLMRMHSIMKQERLSHFEHNLETWRQLWRVLERSDVVCLVADIRFAPIHFSPELYRHVVKELHKQFVLVLNKVDLVPPDVVIAWKHYFQSKYPEVNVVCFTSYPNPDTSLDSQEKVHLKFQKKRKLLSAVGPHQLLEAISSLYSGTEVDFSGWRERLKHNNGSVGTMDIASCKPDVKSSRSGKTDRGVLTIGMIGYPNAGKSSIINGILNEKVVSVSRTPGHTKHFQTIHLSDTLVLCDCPGLVFPTVVDRQLEILSGIYPISQVREPYTVVGYLAQRVPLIHLLRLNNPNQSVEEGCPEKWTAWDVCDAWAEKRGYYTAKASHLDAYRAANSLLRLVCDGRIQFCLLPKDFCKERDKWSCHPEMMEIVALQKKGLVRKMESLSSPSSSSSEDDKESGDILLEHKSNPFSALV